MKKDFILYNELAALDFQDLGGLDKLGAFRGIVTDPHKTVVLRYSLRTVLASPDSPDEFEREIKTIGFTA